MSVAPAEHRYPHVELDARGVPVIAGTTLKVIEVVMAQRAHGWSPEELSFAASLRAGSEQSPLAQRLAALKHRP